ncbi:MAG TPA: TonB-dependent receptor [Longimicrobiales bacterium]
MRLDRYLGALDLERLRDRALIGPFGLSDFEFLGEDFTRRPIEEQIAAAIPIPGYRAPGGSVGSPFGSAAEGIFETVGTPDLAAWSRSDFFSGEVVAEMNTASGHALRGGASAKLFRVESYERLLGHLAGSLPNYARFYPRTLTAFAEGRLTAADQATIHVGMRVEAFQPGLEFSPNRSDFLAVPQETRWKVHLMPRIGVSMPLPGLETQTTLRFAWGRVAQPPDFRYFLDTAIGDSLRTDIRRQGNPNLSFERGSEYEVGITQLLSERTSPSAPSRSTRSSAAS